MRHTTVALTSGVLVAGFWLGRMDWDVEMRTWRAFGDAAMVLLFVTLALGPGARLLTSVGRALPWRREMGVWFAIMALVHSLLVFDGWVEWDLGRMLGYEFIPQLGRTARLEPGFGLSNLVGLIALAWALLLAVTSSDRAVAALGAAAWKWLHNGAYVVFYLTVLHAAYFLFMHYTVSFHRTMPPPNGFGWPLLGMGLAVAFLQWAAFIRTVRRRRKVSGQRLAAAMRDGRHETRRSRLAPP